MKLAPRAGKTNQILRCDWLPEGAINIGRYPAILTSHLVNNPYVIGLSGVQFSLYSYASDNKIGQPRSGSLIGLSLV